MKITKITTVPHSIDIDRHVGQVVNTKGFSKIKLFSKNDIENFFKKKIVSNLNKRQLLNKKFDKLDIPYYHKIVSNDLIHKKLIDPGKRKVKL